MLAAMAKPSTPTLPPSDDDAAPEPVSRHIMPLGPRVLVRLVRSADRTETGLYLPQGAKDAQEESLLAEVVEVARTMPTQHPLVDDPDEELDDDDGRDARVDLGKNVSGVPLGSQVLFQKQRGVRVPWDDSLRILEVRHILAIVETISPDDIQ